MGRLLLTLLLLASPLAAQVTTGGIEGRVTDPTGALLPGVKVRAENLNTRAAVDVQTDSGGRYLLPRLQPGRYLVSFSASGFQPASWTIQVRVGELANLSPALRLGRAEQTVEVHEFGVAVDTTSSATQSVITQEEISELPLQQRSFTDLMALVPGVRPQGSFARNKSRAGAFSVFGSDGRNAEVNLDGVDNRDYFFGGYLQALPLSTVQELRVTTADAPPEAGRSSGALVDVVSRPAAAALHGGLFAYFREDALASRTFFEARDGSPDAPSSRQHLGGALGGGLTDKLYLWAGAEFLRDRDHNFVPDAALADLALVPGAAPQQFIPRPYDDLLVSGRLDWLRDPRNHFFLRLAGQRNRGDNELMGDPAAADLSNGNQTTNRFLSAAFAWTHTFSSASLNDLRLGFVDARSTVLPNSTAPNLAFAVQSVPGIPDAPAVQIGANQNTPGVFYQTRWQLRDDLTLTRGRHHLQLGVSDFYQPRFGGFFLFGSLGYTIFFFDRPSVIVANPGLYPDGLATPGAVRQITLATGDGSFDQPVNFFAVYLNDRIRLTPGLTLNLGLRYDWQPGFYPDLRRDPAFQLLAAINSPLASEPAGDPTHMLQPRIGIAWDADGKGRSVFRLSYGIFFDSMLQQFTFPALQRMNPELFSTPIDLVNTRAGGIGPATGGDIPGFRFGVDPLPAAPPATELAPGATIRYLDPRFTNPYTQQWSAGYERRFRELWSVNAGYTHVLGLHEHMVQEANPRPLGGGPRILADDFAAAGIANPLGSIRLFASANRSRYDALNLTLRRSFHGRWYLNATYTLSRAVTWGGRYSSSYNFGRPRVSIFDAFGPGEHGTTSADEPHRLVASGIFVLPGNVEVAPLLQAASARPYTLFSGNDDNGDAVFGGSGEEGIYGDRLTVDGRQLPVNSRRGDPFFQLDLRVSRAFRLGDKGELRLLADFFNLTNADNFGNNYFNVGVEALHDPQPRGLFGKQGEVGSVVGIPFAAQFGVRMTF